MSSSDIFKPYNPNTPVYGPRLKDERWKELKPLFTNLHYQGLTQKRMFEVARDQHNFEGTESALYSRLRRWGLTVYDRRQTSDPGPPPSSLELSEQNTPKSTEIEKSYSMTNPSKDQRQPIVNTSPIQPLSGNDNAETNPLDQAPGNLNKMLADCSTVENLTSLNLQDSPQMDLSPNIYAPWPDLWLETSFESPRPAPAPPSHRSSIPPFSNKTKTSDKAVQTTLMDEDNSSNSYPNISDERVEHAKRTHSMAWSDHSSIVRMSNQSIQSFLRYAKRLKTNLPSLSQHASVAASLLSFASPRQSWRFSWSSQCENPVDAVEVKEMLRRSLDGSTMVTPEDGTSNKFSWLDLPGITQASDLFLELVMKNENSHTNLPSGEVVDLPSLSEKYNYDLNTPCWELLFGWLDTYRANTKSVDFQVILSNSIEQRLVSPYEQPLSVLEEQRRRGLSPVLSIRETNKVSLVVNLDEQEWFEITQNSPVIRRVQSLRIYPEDKVDDVFKLITGNINAGATQDLRLCLSVDHSNIRSRDLRLEEEPVTAVRDLLDLGFIPRLAIRRTRQSEFSALSVRNKDRSAESAQQVETQPMNTQINDVDLLSEPSIQPFKMVRVCIEDPCIKVLPVALKKYNIEGDWRQYGLYLLYDGQERHVGLEEKPLKMFKQLDREGKNPHFMLRRLPQTHSFDLTPLTPPATDTELASPPVAE